MARLVIVSNRVPVPAKKREQQAGGLAVVLEEALKGEVLWFGWSGRHSEGSKMRRASSVVPAVSSTYCARGQRCFMSARAAVSSPGSANA